eukprot:TRINITY_DN9841_c0_g1_i2.p1 TRINITY_DN9841_c0_g1~~TRINITY_DN9841_c0_g1_i2.p1  ORF type:complete len:108 (+),score=7.64 TRINITY_DN9841_c0_g1_i2:351-674(+)
MESLGHRQIPAEHRPPLKENASALRSSLKRSASCWTTSCSVYAPLYSECSVTPRAGAEYNMVQAMCIVRRAQHLGARCGLCGRLSEGQHACASRFSQALACTRRAEQ